MSPRSRWSLLVFALVALVVAGALTDGFTLPASPPLPSEKVEARREPGGAEVPAANVIDPAGLAPVVQSELNCVDRLLRNGTPAGADPKAEWDRCAQQTEAAERAGAIDPALELDRVGNGSGEAGAGGRP